MKRILQLIRPYAFGVVITVILLGLSIFYWKGILRWFVGEEYALELSGASREFTAGPFTIATALKPDPPLVGKNRLDVHLKDRHGIPIEGAAIRIVTNPESREEVPDTKSMAEIHNAVILKENGQGDYRATFELSTEGTLTLVMDVRTVDGRHADFTFSTVPESAGLTFVQSSAAETGGAEGDIAYYTCSMHPSVRSNDPGTCPICAMDLVPVTREEAETGMVIVDARRRQLIGVKTGEVKRQDLVQTIRAIGKVTYDEARLTDVSLKFSGWIGEIFADYTGKFVRQGEPLFTIYSPELLTAQNEYLDGYKRSRDKGAERNGILKAAHTRLLLWDLTEDQITGLRQAGQASEYVPILSPASGVVVIKHVVRGSRIDAGKMFYRIADLATVWVEADVYEYELPLVRAGQEAIITLSYLPEWREKGRITYVYPYLDPKTRTARFRMEVPNPDGTLKPEMYANVELQIPLGERLTVPEGAVIYAGDTRLVFVDRGEGRLEPVRIKVGVKNKDVFEVLEGLQEGETVVTSANFLIAAESKMKAAVAKW
ncbi:MAG: efflux RND transporter periplasmic adaptor subunit [Candidatus Neomarinimicrobiota bacterium]